MSKDSDCNILRESELENISINLEDSNNSDYLENRILDDKNIAINFLKASEEECIKFAEKVEAQEIEDPILRETFEYFNKKNDYMESEAIILIKNIILTQQYVNCYRTDYPTYSGKVLLKAATFIPGDQSLNFKILKALFDSQFNGTRIKDSARFEILTEIIERLEYTTKNEKDEISYMHSVFLDYFSEENKFNIHYNPGD